MDRGRFGGRGSLPGWNPSRVKREGNRPDCLAFPVDLYLWYISESREIPEMSTTKTAKLFRNGRSQAVRLPREFRFQGNEVRVRQIGDAVLLEPIISDTHKWFEELDRFKSEPFMRKGSRNQPRTPRRKIFE